MIIKYQCINCKKECECQRSPTQNQTPKYCGNACRIIDKKAKVSIYGTSNCNQCGKEFTWKRPINQGPAKLCSNNCKPIHLKCDVLKEYIYKIFNERVIKNENACWDWTGIIDTKQGYARINVQRKNYSAHRISWEIHKGEIPNGLQINHHCDNRRCTNPDHLYLGTQKQNDQDRVKRNRQAKGSKNGSAILNEDLVKEIKYLLLCGVTQKKIKEKYNVSVGTISNIATEKNWKHVNIG